MINFWSFKRSWNRVGKQQSLSLWTRYIPWPWVRCDCIVGHTFPKLHVHSGGYFVRTKLNTFPTTGILDSVKIEDNTWMKTCSKVMIDCGSLRSNSRVQTRLAQRQQALPSMTIIRWLSAIIDGTIRNRSLEHWSFLKNSGGREHVYRDHADRE
jgi:hypothetical protein